KPPIPFTSIPIEDEDITVEQVGKILRQVSGYRKVTAYYNHFRTILTSDVLEADLNLTEAKSENDEQKEPEPEPKGLAKYIKKDDALFEPSLEEVLNFYETVILKTLLRQKVRESLLSRYAARMVAMDIATENAKTATKALNRDSRRAQRRKANQRMPDGYS